MEVILYSEFSKRTNSTKNPTSPEAVSVSVTKEAKLKGVCSLLNPSFFIADVTGYVYLKAWGWYYFITNIAYDINGAQYIECKLDALGTWRDVIHNSTFFIERCSDNRYYNTDIRDDALSVEDIVEHTNSANTYCGIASDLMYIVRILGRESTGGVGTFITNLYDMKNIFSQMWADIDDGLGMGDLEEFMQMWIADPIKYVIGVYSTPIGFSNYENNISLETVYFGGHKTNIQWDRINVAAKTIFSGILNKPTSIYSDFRKGDAAFSSYTIYIPTIGTVPLSSDLIECELSMDIGADLLSGDLLFTLKADGNIVSTYRSNCYATQSIGVVNEADAIITGALDTATAGLNGKVGGVVEGIKSAMSPTPSVIGSQGGTGCVTTANEIVITCCQKSSAEFPLNDYGRPCCKNLRLGDLTGFIKTANASINISAPDGVRNIINNALNSGIFIE